MISGVFRMLRDFRRIIHRPGAIALAWLPSLAPALSEPVDPRTGLLVSVWDADRDLPNNDIHAILQDRRGFLWVGTAGGLVRFDGRSFRRPPGSDAEFFQASTTFSATETLPGTIVFVHDLDAENLILVATAAGISPHPVNALLAAGERAAAVFHGGGGSLWILLTDRTCLHWRDGRVRRIAAPAKYSTHPASVVALGDGLTLLARGGGLELDDGRETTTQAGFWRGAVALARRRAGGVLVADGRSLFDWHSDGSHDEIGRPAAIADGPWPPQVMHEAADGALWMYFRETGLWRITGEDAVQVPTSHPLVRCLAEDREGNLWVGTAAGGLNQIRKPGFSLWAEDRSDTIGSVCEDARGNMWLGNSAGIWRLDNGKAVPPDDPEGWPQSIQSLCPTPDGALWIGTANHVFRYRPGLDPRPLPMPPGEITNAYALFRDRAGAVWAGCETGPLLRYTGDGPPDAFGPAEGYGGNFAQVFGEDEAGTLWVGTRRGELFARRGESFEKTPTPLEATGTGILTITAGSGGALWLGTRGQGFLRFKHGKFRAVGPQHGLPDGIIAQTLVVDDQLWVGSASSIFQVSIADLDACADGFADQVRPVRYGRSDGVANFFATGQRQPCAWRATDGSLWFVSRNGVVVTRPAKHDGSWAPPPVYIDHAVADDGPVAPGGVISSGNRRLLFSFSSPTFSAPENLRFRWRLAGLEDDWSAPVLQHEAVFPALPPGRYTFEASSSIRPRIWSIVPARFEVTVAPRWWELTWLRALAALAALAAIAILARAWSNRRLRRKTARLEQERKLDQERARIARDLHDGIGSGLTQLGWLAADLHEQAADPAAVGDQAELLGGRIRDLARDLDAAVWAASPRHDTLASLCAYLCESALEHFCRTNVRCRVSAPDELPARPLSPQFRSHLFMAAREVLTNALKHAGANEVRLEITFDGTSLHVEIADDGCGFDPAAARHGARHGLRNIAERLAEIGGTTVIDSQPHGSGTRVRLSAPLDASGETTARQR